MIEKIEVTGIDQFIQRAGEKYPSAVKQGTSAGVRQFVGVLGQNVRDHTPVRSGRSLGAVYDRMRSDYTGVVGYDTKEAFYTRFWVFGSRPHPIFAGALKGSADSRRLGRYLRRHGHQMSAAGIASTSFSYLGANATQFAHSLNSRATSAAGERALWKYSQLKRALSFGGMVRAWVKHSGIKGRFTLRTSLAATRSQAAPLITLAVYAEIEKVSH